MKKILSWVKARMPYERDVFQTETIHDPLESLERINVYNAAPGDCDDASVLMAALLQAVGIGVRFIALSVKPNRRLHHVAVEAQDRRTGKWHYLDPFGGTGDYTAAMRLTV